MGAFRKEGWRGIPVLGRTPNTNTPPFVFSRPFIYLLTVCRKKMKTHTLFKQRSNALELWWIYSWKFNLADATFTLKNQGPVRKMAYISLTSYPNFYLIKHTRLFPFSSTLSLHSAIETINTLFSTEGIYDNNLSGTGLVETPIVIICRTEGKFTLWETFYNETLF